MRNVWTLRNTEFKVTQISSATEIFPNRMLASKLKKKKLFQVGKSLYFAPVLNHTSLTPAVHYMLDAAQMQHNTQPLLHMHIQESTFRSWACESRQVSAGVRSH